MHDQKNNLMQIHLTSSLDVYISTSVCCRHSDSVTLRVDTIKTRSISSSNGLMDPVLVTLTQTLSPWLSVIKRALTKLKHKADNI